MVSVLPYLLGSSIPAWLRVGGTPEGTGGFTGKVHGVPLSLGPRRLQGLQGWGLCPLHPSVPSRALSSWISCPLPSREPSTLQGPTTHWLSKYETKGGASWGVAGIGNTLVFSQPFSPGEPPKTPRLSLPTFRTTSMLLACPPSGTPSSPASILHLPESSSLWSPHPLENLIPLGTSICPLDWADCPQGFPSALCGLPLLSKALSSLLGHLIPPGSPRLSSFLLSPGSPSSIWPLTPPRALSDFWTGLTIIQHPSYPLVPFAFWGPPPSSMATLPRGTLHPPGQDLCSPGPPLSSGTPPRAPSAHIGPVVAGRRGNGARPAGKAPPGMEEKGIHLVFPNPWPQEASWGPGPYPLYLKAGGTAESLWLYGSRAISEGLDPQSEPHPCLNPILKLFYT